MAVAAVGRTPSSFPVREAVVETASAASLRARVVTTQAGLSLGKFGISYTSRNIEFFDGSGASSGPTAESVASRRGGFSRTESFASVLEAATLAQGLGDLTAALPSAESQASPTTSPFRAAAAYLAAATACLTPPPARTLLATV